MNLGTNLHSSKEFTKQYYKILSKDFPDFLWNYINTKEMQRINTSAISCGCNYTNLYNLEFFYSNLDHSIAVALIIWNFTKNKKATLAGLFHDIATPTFKHCIDFMNGDYEHQESIEERTEAIITSSNEIMSLLKKDAIVLEEVIDYKLYSIADNDTPKLSSDRLEYTLSNMIFWQRNSTLHEIKQMYDNLEILINEDGIEELGFKDIAVAETFIKKAQSLWYSWTDNKDKLVMQFIADYVALLHKEGSLSIDDLYRLSELEIITMFLQHKNKSISQQFSDFMQATNIGESDSYVEKTYCKSIKTKKRYIDPLVKTSQGVKRVSHISKSSNDYITNFLKFKTKKYGYLKL